jgi:hypothetical protein
MFSDVKKESFEVGNSCKCLTNGENFSCSSVAEFTGGLLQNIRLDIAISRKSKQKGNSTVSSSCLEGAYRRVHPVQFAFFDHRTSWPRLETNKANYEAVASVTGYQPHMILRHPSSFPDCYVQMAFSKPISDVCFREQEQPVSILSHPYY